MTFYTRQTSLEFMVLSKRFCNEAVIITLMQTQQLVVIDMEMSLWRKLPGVQELLVATMQTATLVVVAILVTDGTLLAKEPTVNPLQIPVILE